MAGSTAGTGSSSASPSPPPPKILLAKPGLVTGGPVAGKFGRGGGEEEAASLRSRLTSIGSLNLLSDSWEFYFDRFLPFLTDNTDFTVVGIIGPPGVGKSTIMNEIYGFDGSSSGMLLPFTTQSEDIRAMAKHCTVGIEPRVSSERIILLDTQPVFSPSILAEIMKPDGSCTISVLSGESPSAELAHELIGIQLGILLASICNILLVVSEGVHDTNMWRLMSTVDLLKHGIPDPSSLILSHPQSSNVGTERENKYRTEGEEYMATPIFVHTKIQDQDLSPNNFTQVRKALARYFNASSFMRSCQSSDPDSAGPSLFLMSSKDKDDSVRDQYESCTLMLWKLRDQVLSMNCPSFERTVSERDWLKNSAKIWELVKNSPIIAEYNRTLQSSGMFRR